MTMFERLPAPAWQQMELFPMSLREVFHANPTALPVSEEPAQTSATCGPSSPASFARLGPDGCWLKTCQGYVQARLDGSLEEYCETWPAQGIVSNGEAYPLPMWERHTGGTGFGSSPTHSVPTPTASDHIERACTSQQSPLNFETNKSVSLDRFVKQFPTPVAKDDGKSFEGHMAMKARMGRSTCSSLAVMARSGMWPTPRGMDGPKGSRALTPGGIAHVESGRGNLAEYVQMWPTPASRDYRHPNAQSYAERGGGTKGEQLPNAVGGALNPTWVEWLMGLPAGWTDLEA